MKKVSIMILMLSMLLSGCSNNESMEPKQAGLVGSDKDRHGCIGSAGYSWCERIEQCERPWELAQQEGFEKTPEGFQQYCDKLSLKTH